MEHLVVTLLGADQHGIANEIFKLVAHCGCYIVDASVDSMEHEFTATLLLAGNWNTLAKFESSLPHFEKKHDIRALLRRTQAATPPVEELPYIAYLVAPDSPDILHTITQFLAEETVKLYELVVNAYQAPHSKLAMLSIMIVLSIPTSKSVADFRERFALFADDNNLDIAMEPRKN